MFFPSFTFRPLGGWVGVCVWGGGAPIVAAVVGLTPNPPLDSTLLDKHRLKSMKITAEADL
jgi:hypothetical protein